MALLAMCSAKGSPGVTATALAFALSWRRPLVLAECDPAGGDIAAGYLRELPLGERGLSQLTASLHRGRLADDFWGQLVDLAPGDGTALTKLLLPGLTDPMQATRWVERRRPGEADGWRQLAELFTAAGTADRYDVLADCGRLSAAHASTALLTAADAVLLVVRPTLPSMRAAAVALTVLRGADRPPIGLVLVGDRPYTAREISAELGIEVVATLPDDPGTAGVLSLGGTHHRGQLLRAAARVEADVWRLVQSRPAMHRMEAAGAS
jgi:hypothetical protein